MPVDDSGVQDRTNGTSENAASTCWLFGPGVQPDGEPEVTGEGSTHALAVVSLDRPQVSERESTCSGSL